jgi:flagellar biogenesis protein FliO
MWTNPLFPAVIVVIIMIIYASYLLYRIWFNDQATLKSARKRIYRLPTWYPFKGFYTDWVNDHKSWLTYQKVMSVFVETLLIVILILVLIAWIKGN